LRLALAALHCRLQLVSSESKKRRRSITIRDNDDDTNNNNNNNNNNGHNRNTIVKHNVTNSNAVYVSDDDNDGNAYNDNPTTNATPPTKKLRLKQSTNDNMTTTKAAAVTAVATAPILARFVSGAKASAEAASTATEVQQQPRHLSAAHVEPPPFVDVVDLPDDATSTSVRSCAVTAQVCFLRHDCLFAQFAGLSRRSDWFLERD
jgi:hypothetical protein